MKSWNDYPIEEIIYGLHKYGIGPYRFDPKTGLNTGEYWQDVEQCTEEEKERYKKYLEDYEKY
jgi:hypothetical protein